MTTHGASVRDATDADFQRAVIERSRDVPVVVDFWAPWCGPCRQLGPVLERLASEANGAWELVKVNTDENPRTATQYRIEGIPAVKGFRDGKMVAEFTGALPEPRVRAWLNGLLPSEADRLADEGAEMERLGYLATAEDRYRDALTQAPNHARATIGLARILAERGATDEALSLLDQLPSDPEARATRAAIQMKATAGDADVPALEAQVAANPKDAVARYDLGRALAAKGDYGPALDQLLNVVKLDRTLDGDGGRKAMLDIFALLGDDDPRTHEYRKKLGYLLF